MAAGGGARPGVGIPAGHHELIFEDFHRVQRGEDRSGTGLGLAICRRIVERHGGRITARDEPDGGACFAFTLPVATGTPAPEARPEALAAP